MTKNVLPESGLRRTMGVVMLTLHFMNVLYGFYMPLMIVGIMDYLAGVNLLFMVFLIPPLFLILNIVNAVSFACHKQFREIRELMNIVRIVTDVTLAVNVVGIVLLAVLTGVLMTGLAGLFSWIGVGFVFGMTFWYGVCCSLSASAYVIGEIWMAFREGEVEKVSAVVHTVLQIIPFVSLIDGIVIYSTTGKRRAV